MAVSLTHVEILIRQRRFVEAESGLRDYLSHEPSDVHALGMLWQCMMSGQQYDKAIILSHEMLTLAPNDDSSHRLLAYALCANGQSKKALGHMDQAIAIEPHGAENFYGKAHALYNLGQWQAVLDTVDQALSLDPDAVSALNLRSMALVKLGREEEAAIGIVDTLRQDPENADTHGSQGWALVQQGKFKEAEVHFREALRLEPENTWAREGVLNCLRAKTGIYALLLRYYMWMSKLSGRAQFGVMLGGYLLYRTLFTIEATNVYMSLGISILISLYILFGLFSWIGTPLVNFFLQFHPFGRLALKKEEKKTANWVSLFALTGLCFGGYEMVADTGWAFLVAYFLLTLSIPIARYLECPPSVQKKRYRLWMLGFFVLCIALVLALFVSPRHVETLFDAYIYGFLAFCIFGNVGEH